MQFAIVEAWGAMLGKLLPSGGRLLAAGNGGKELFILSPDEGAQPGMRVK